MKTISAKLICLLLALPLLFWSCSDDDTDLLAPPTASFTKTVDPDNPYKFFFENTTPNSGDYYSYWQFKEGGTRVVDAEGAEENEFSDGGDYIVTLTVVGQGTVSQATQSISLENKPAPPTPTDPDNPDNLLLNGNLELGEGDEFTNWGKFNGADRMTQETEDVFKGDRAMRVVNPAEGAQFETQLVSDAVPTVSGSFYTVSLWIKGGPGTIRFSTNAGLGNEQYGGDTDVTEDWSQIAYTFAANSEETNIAIDMGASAATYIVDDIQLIPGSEPAPAPGAGPQGPENFILNGGFEAGDNNDFTNWGKFNGADRMTQETEDVFEGSRALKVVNPAEGAQFETQLVSDAVATEPGTEYTVSLWIKGGPGTIRFSTNAGLGDEQYGGDTDVTEDWSQIAFTFTAATDETNIALDMGASAATYIVDDVQLIAGNEPAPAPGTQEPAGPESIVLNGGLEEGDNNEFTNWGKFNGADRMTQETEDVYEGSRALKVVNPAAGAQFETQLVSDAVPTESGADYTASLWIKGGPGNIRISTNAGLGNEQYGGDTDVTEDWSQIVYTFTANTDETNLALDMGASAATYIVDKIELIKVEEE